MPLNAQKTAVRNVTTKQKGQQRQSKKVLWGSQRRAHKMGMCLSCCGNSAEETNLMPPAEERRRQQLEAAERRVRENETRGVKNLDKVRRQQQRAEEMERREEEAARQGGNPTLRWQTS
ncbi:hypothetical protein ACLKA7_017140 [Drosophila subpalustris]